MIAVLPGVRVELATVDTVDVRVVHPTDEQRARDMSPWRRAEFLAGRALIRRLLAAVAPQAENAEVRRDARGRPELVGWPIGVSVSHDDGVVAAAVAPGGRVGVDVQRVPARHSAWLARRLLGRHYRPAVPVSELAWVWTAQEACVKADGTGLAGRPWQIDVAPYARHGRWGAYRWVSLRDSSPVPLSCAVAPLEQERKSHG